MAKKTKQKIFEVKQVGARSMAKLCAAWYALFGLVYGLMIVVMAGFGASIFGAVGFVASFLLGFVVLPIVFAVLGAVFGLIAAAFYNLVASRLGGIKLALE